MIHVKFFAREYTDADRALFARYQDERLPLRPPECTGKGMCWWRCGPPCYRTNGTLGDCTGCGGRVKNRGGEL